MRRAFSLAGLLGLACSTVARPEPASGCESDDDCPADEVCSLDQGGVCLPGEAPPRAFLAFEITEQSFRAEVEGCDEDLIRFDKNKLLLEVVREDVVQTVDLHVRDTVEGKDCTPFSGCNPEIGYLCLESEQLCVAQLSSTLTLRQDSRIGLATQPPSPKKYPLLDENEAPLGDPVAFDWAHPGDQSAPPILLDVAPDGQKKGRYRRALTLDVDQHTHALDDRGEYRCHRNLVGTVRRFGGGPVLAATATVSFAEPVATPSTLLGGLGPACDQDDECPTGMACNQDFGTCGLDLTGQRAGEAVSSDAGGISAWIYSYCEDAKVAVDRRDFTIDVSPPEISGLPQVRVGIEQTFGLPLGVDGFPPINVPPAQLEADLCVPDWPSPETIEFEIGAAPVTLVTTEGGVTWRCCDAQCLPAGEILGAEAPNPEDTCLDVDSIRVSTPVLAPDPDEWEADGCLPTVEDENGHVGEFVRFVTGADACTAQLCSVGLPPDNDADDLRAFTVDVTHAMTSVFRSETLSIVIDPLTKRLSKNVTFKPRTLLRGEIVCAENTENCTATEAVIIAERLRMPGASDPLGPYLFSQVAYATSETEDGEPRGASFSMPVNPGVYLVTALPAAGRGGGPARYAVVDLRNGAPGVSEGLVPKLDLEDPIQLEAGLAVRVQLEDFDRSTQVRPIDTGSWTAQDDLTLPDSDDPLDLNDPTTCYNASPGQACRIRSLTRPDAPNLSLLQSGRVQFTTRNVKGGKACPGA